MRSAAHHTETLRFDRQQSRTMREAVWAKRMKMPRPMWIDLAIAVIGASILLLTYFAMP